MPAGILRAAALLCCLRVAAGAELRVYYSAIERVVAQQVFTQDGRWSAPSSAATTAEC